MRIFGALGQHLFPTGFRPGINATFDQILEFRGPTTLLLTPVSIIVTNSIRASTTMEASSGLISELIQCSDGNLNRFCCRVVSVHVLVPEKRNMKCYDFKSNMHSRPLSVDIPLACFVLESIDENTA